MTRRQSVTFDELTVLGAITAFAYLLISVAWIRRGGLAELIWLCDLATLGTAIGLLSRSRLILTAQFAGMLAYHLGWQIDFLSYVITDRMPFSATAYMFSGDLTAYEKALSFFQHIFVVPVCFWALLRLGASRSGWLFQTIQTSVAFVVTYVFTKPAQNINWIFGAGFASLSPASMNPLVYYIIMALLPPLLVYIPTNLLALWLTSGCRLTDRHRGQRTAVALAGSALAAVLAAAVGSACDLNTNLPATILSLPPRGTAPLEGVEVTENRPRVVTVAYGLPGRETQIPLRTWPAALPRTKGQDGTAGPLFLREITNSVPIGEIPKSPQQVVIRGVRGHKGTVVCAIVGADRFYAQPRCDTQTALDRFELHCQLGAEGLAEFVHPQSGVRRAPLEHQAIVNGALESLCSVTIVAFDRRMKLTRSPTYLLRRTGVYLPDDVAWSGTDQRRTATMKPPPSPP
jgi:hypothetical protein